MKNGFQVPNGDKELGGKLNSNLLSIYTSFFQNNGF